MTERRTIYQKTTGEVINIWADFDPANPDHAGWVPPLHLALGPADPDVEVGDTFDGTTYIPAPPPPPPDQIDIPPTALDVVSEVLIKFAVLKGDGTPITKADLPQDWQDRIKT